MADDYESQLPVRTTVDYLRGVKETSTGSGVYESVNIARANITNGASPADLEALDDRVVVVETAVPGFAEKATVPTYAGAAVITGDLSGFEVDVPIASAEDAAAGTNNTDVMTPLRTKTAILANLSAVSPIGTSWDRLADVDGLTATMRDANLKKFIRSDGSVWRDDDDTALEAPAFILDAVALPSAMAFSLSRKLRADYAGYLGRLERTSDSATLDYSNIAEAIAFGGDKVLGVYQQAEDSTVAAGTLVTFASPLDLVMSDGLIGAKNPSTSATVVLHTMSSTDRNLFKNNDGMAFYGAFAFPMPYVSYSSFTSGMTLFRITNNAGNNRHLIRTSSGGYLEFVGRRLDADSEGTLSLDKLFGGLRSLCFNVRNIDAELDFIKDGYTHRVKAWQTSGSVSNSNPTLGELRVQIASTFFEAIAWHSPLDSSQRAYVRLDQRAFNPARRNLNNAGASWWSNVAAAHPTLPITVCGFSGTHGVDTGSTQIAFQGVAEFDNATGEIIAMNILESGIHAQDDHNVTAPHYLDDGSLIIGCVGHGLSIGGTNNGRVVAYYSTTGRIADLGSAITLPSTMTAANYGWWIEGVSKLLFYSNDDTTVGWRFYYSDDKDPNAFVEGRNVVQQGSAPGGGSNQMYSLVAQRGNTAFLFCTAHTTNLQNPIRLGWLDIPTGAVYNATGGSSLGNAYSAGSALVALPSLPAIYTPGTGKSARLLDAVVRDDWAAVCLCVFDNADGANGMHVLLVWDGVGNIENSASWTAHNVGASGVEFWAPGHYTPDMKIAREEHRGIRVYRTYESGGTWYLERKDSANNGVSWRTTAITSDATYPIERVFVPTDADPRLPAIRLRGTYITYTNWRMGMAPVVVNGETITVNAGVSP